jgi:hypothetical protein
MCLTPCGLPYAATFSQVTAVAARSPARWRDLLHPQANADRRQRSQAPVGPGLAKNPELQRSARVAGSSPDVNPWSSSSSGGTRIERAYRFQVRNRAPLRRAMSLVLSVGARPAILLMPLFDAPHWASRLSLPAIGPSLRMSQGQLLRSALVAHEASLTNVVAPCSQRMLLIAPRPL